MQRQVAERGEGSQDTGPASLTKTTFRLPKTLLKDVQHYAVDHDTTDQAVFIAALKAYLPTTSTDVERAGEKEK